LVDGVDQPVSPDPTQHMKTTILKSLNSGIDVSKNQFHNGIDSLQAIDSVESMPRGLKSFKPGLNYTARTAHNVCDPNYRLIKIFSILQWPNLLLCVCNFFVSFFAQKEKKLNYSCLLYSEYVLYLLLYNLTFFKLKLSMLENRCTVTTV
jgi:hypothetical protein